MDHTATTETHRVRCPCGEILYATADSGVETCTSCGGTFRWRAETASRAQTAPHTTPKAYSPWNAQAAPQRSKTFSSPQERSPLVVAHRPESPVAKTDGGAAIVKLIYRGGFWLSFVLLFLGFWIGASPATGSSLACSSDGYRVPSLH